MDEPSCKIVKTGLPGHVSLRLFNPITLLIALAGHNLFIFTRIISPQKDQFLTIWHHATRKYWS